MNIERRARLALWIVKIRTFGWLALKCWILFLSTIGPFLAGWHQSRMLKSFKRDAARHMARCEFFIRECRRLASAGADSPDDHKSRLLQHKDILLARSNVLLLRAKQLESGSASAPVVVLLSVVKITRVIAEGDRRRVPR
jgi:hypothetical protein